MGPGYFILAIMGCGDGTAMCQEVRDTGRVYRSEVECLADSEATLMSASELSYPEIMVECRAISPQVAQRRMANPAG